MNDELKEEIKEKSEKLDKLIEKYDNNFFSLFDFKKEILKLFYDFNETQNSKKNTDTNLQEYLDNWKWDFPLSDLDDEMSLFLMNLNLLEIKNSIIKLNYNIHLRQLKIKHGEIDFILNMNREKFSDQLISKMDKIEMDFYLTNKNLISKLKEYGILKNTIDNKFLLSTMGKELLEINNLKNGYCQYLDKIYFKAEILKKTSELVEKLKKDKELQFSFDW